MKIYDKNGYLHAEIEVEKVSQGIYNLVQRDAYGNVTKVNKYVPYSEACLAKKEWASYEKQQAKKQ